MNIEILGSGCKKCMDLMENTKQALIELGLEADIEKVSDIRKIMEYKVLVTPGIVVDGVVVASGKLNSVEEIKEILKSID